jgi:hypothetical protein
MMPPNPRSDVAATRDCLVSHVNSSCSRRKGPGRPSQGIRSGYVRVEVYLPPNVREELDRLVSQRAHQTGRSTHRADLIREALVMYLRHADHQET